MIALFCLLICFDANKPVVVSDFCELTRREIAQLQALTPDELKHLQRPRKNAIASLRRSYRAHCSGKK